ncbi:MAG: MFS transporter [Candidatus Pacebacteria bacterium]|nr:MFS transporter [Candidatus Paceibacterota bacterium]
MKKNRRIIFFVGFLLTIPIALTSYINSSLLQSFTNPFQVSAIYVVASILTIIILSRIPKILSRIGNLKTATIISCSTFLSLLALAYGKNVELIVIAFVVYFISTHLLIMTLDIFIEDFTKQSSVGKMRGLYLTFINLAWVTAQLISGSIIAKSSFKGIYLLASFFIVLQALVLVIFFRKWQDPIYKKIAIWKTIKFFIRNKNIHQIYLISLILKFFFAWMIIYTPIYLHEYLNFGWDKIGIIFTIMLTPFVILTFPLGKLSDKIGEKKMLYIGFTISAIFTFIIPFITLPKLLLWAFILFMTRVGAATIEIMSESYFFKQVTEEHADEVSFFRNTAPMAFIIAPLSAIFILALSPSFEYIFFVLSALLLVGLFLSLRLKEFK